MTRHLELGLTSRERQVALLVKDGLTDRDIAERLFITRRTAEWHLKQIFNKLGFNSRAQVAAWVAHEQAAGPAAESSGPSRGNLPLQLTTFVGRTDDLNSIGGLLAHMRLVTLTAVGGSGKTRLALEVATRTLGSYTDGAWLVDLSPIPNGRLVPRAFASAFSVHERPRQLLAHTLVEHLRDRSMLLVVDNCEHVIEDCAALVNTILRSCEGITVLATSREPLRVNGEKVWHVTPLAAPDPAAPLDLDALAECDSIRLFVDRAQLSAPSFKLTEQNALAVGRLCSELDGLPLAIEVAASRAGSMSPEQMLDRLSDRFALLTVGTRSGPFRHRSLQAALDWSYDLLSEGERTLFQRLSVFAGTFSLEAVEGVCSGDGLERVAVSSIVGRLVDKSMVVAATGIAPEIRFRMLDTVNQYASERLDLGRNLDELNRRHFQFFLSFAQDAGPRLVGPDARMWRQRLADDLSNLRLALTWSRGRDARTHLVLAIALTDFWHLHGLVQEGDAWITAALSDYPYHDAMRAQGLDAGANISYWRGDFDGDSGRSHESLEIYRQLGRTKEVGRALTRVGQLSEWQGDFARAHSFYDQALAMAKLAQDKRGIELAIRYLGRLAIHEGDHARARSLLGESLSLNERFGDARGRHWTLGYLGINAVDCGAAAEARSFLAESLKVALALDLTIGIATLLEYFAALAAAESDHVRALRLAGAAESLSESAGAAPVRLTKPIVERWLARSRKALGQKHAAAHLAEGRPMSRERAAEYALGA